MEENKLETKLDKIIEQQDEIIKILKVSNGLPLIDFEKEIMEELNRSNKNEDTIMTEDDRLYYHYIETMMNGFEKGERSDGIYKLACSVLDLAQKRIITLSSALFIVEMTAKNCNPPFEQEDWETQWNLAMDYTNNKIK